MEALCPTPAPDESIWGFLAPPAPASAPAPRPPASLRTLRVPWPQAGLAAGAPGRREAGRAGGGANRARPGPPSTAPSEPAAAVAEGYGAPYIYRGAQARTSAVVLGASRERCRYSQSGGGSGTALSAHCALAAAAAAAEVPQPSQPLRWCSHPRSLCSSSLRSHHGRSGVVNGGVAAACS